MMLLKYYEFCNQNLEESFLRDLRDKIVDGIKGSSILSKIKREQNRMLNDEKSKLKKAKTTEEKSKIKKEYDRKHRLLDNQKEEQLKRQKEKVSKK